MFVITGGAGFIGSNIIASLEERYPDEKLVVVDRLRDGVKWRNIAKRDLYDIVHPDDLYDFLSQYADEIKAIFHMGAISATTETDADKIVDNNFRLTTALWEWCTDNKVRFIYASSAATYGDGENGFDDFQDRKKLKDLLPLNAYGWSKHLFDRTVARSLENKEATPPQWAGLKFFNVYGPNENHKGGQQSVVAHVFPDAKQNLMCRLFKSHHPDYEDGGQLRDFVWVGDVVNVILWLYENEKVSGLFNVGTGKARSFKDLAKAVYVSLEIEPKIHYIDTPVNIRDKYQYFTQANMDKLREAGYDKPFTELEEGVRQYVQDYLNKDDPYR
ncbi:ADP-L-glycero-D-manno-heptose-6-epimerase [Candidatus Terasakiella magnetica]|uniref:ADP-L-glycero-D-manno-heptose-6-epimerase n=1 Tax=Candidatus Terasakiella magnetica TaxID=1867952 RepID=A0A1C3RIE2_9PROT|nr:ADP-glyceromanno-heptose 6-epimerase [Candidatus Terasakiella magnetica]SCA57039.1 ADP-L-glycero-D-manno-heptose-6-epimerase [Candidatus Terasakiella magnetica]